MLRSGLHSGHFFQCAQVCQNMSAVTRMAELTIEKVDNLDFETVVAPAMGGLVIGQEIAQTNKRYIFWRNRMAILLCDEDLRLGKAKKF